MSEEKKTYVLILSKSFPLTHSKARKETGFPRKVKDGLKIHTIRRNYELWEDRIKEIQKGEAVLSIRTWSGKPYEKGSHQIELKRLSKDDGVGIQKIEVFRSKKGVMESYVFTPDNTLPLDIDQLAANDGLSREDWEEWFKDSLHRDRHAVIHFTPFRYWSKK